MRPMDVIWNPVNYACPLKMYTTVPCKLAVATKAIARRHGTFTEVKTSRPRLEYLHLHQLCTWPESPDTCPFYLREYIACQCPAKNLGVQRYHVCSFICLLLNDTSSPFRRLVKRIVEIKQIRRVKNVINTTWYDDQTTAHIYRPYYIATL